MDNLPIILAAGVIFGAIFTWAAVYIFPRLAWLDFPERYNLKRSRLPYPGGVILWLLSLGIVFISSDFEDLVWPLLLLGIVSWYDDRRPLSVFFRLIIHLIIVAWLIAHGVGIEWLGHPFIDTNFPVTQWSGLSVFITGIWLLGIQHAMNWFDGIRGVTVGISAVGFLTLALLGLMRPELWLDPDHLSLTMVNLYLGGLCLGAWWWYWRGKIILGDTGAQVLGLLLGIMSIWAGAKIATTMIVLSLPLLDLLWVIVRRWREGQAPWKGDLLHMPHRLAQLYGDRRASLLLVIASGFLGIGAVYLTGVAKTIVLLGIIIIVGVLQWWLWHRHHS